MASELDVLSKLHPLSWRGILLPYTSRRVGFQHVNAAHKFNFAGEQIEPTGPKALTLEYGIPLLQSLSSTERYGNLFGSALPRLFAAMRDKTPGQLYDPVYGLTLRCVPADYQDETDPLKRDGTTLVISFIHAPEDQDLDQALEVATRGDLITAAGSLDREVQKVDWQQRVPPEPTVNPLQAIGGVADQLETGVNKTLNGIEGYVADVEDLQDEVEDLEDPRTFALQRRANRGKALAHRVRETHGRPDRRLRKVVTRHTMAISEVAVLVGLTLGELLQINTDLVGLTEVPPGTQVNGYRNG